MAKLESCGVDFDLNFFASVDEEKDDDEAGSPGSAFGLSYSLLGGELHPCRYVGSRRLCTLPAVPSICAPEFALLREFSWRAVALLCGGVSLLYLAGFGR